MSGQQTRRFRQGENRKHRRHFSKSQLGHRSTALGPNIPIFHSYISVRR